MLRDSVVVVRTRPRAIPLAMITIRKILHGFPPGSSVHDANCVSRFGSNFLPQLRSDDARLQILKLLVFLALDLLYYNFWWKMRQESRGKVIVKDLSTVSFQRLYY